MSFDVIFLTRIAIMTIRLLFNVAILSAIFLCIIFICLLVSTLVCFVIVFLTFEFFKYYDSSTRNTSSSLTYIRAVCHDVSICSSCQRSSISILSTKNSSYDFFRNSSYVVYLQARVKCSVHSFQRLDRFLLSFLALIENALHAYFMYYNDVDLTLHIRFFTNVFSSIFIVSQCFA